MQILLYKASMRHKTFYDFPIYSVSNLSPRDINA